VNLCRWRSAQFEECPSGFRATASMKSDIQLVRLV
jgi:hypothetical protein